MERPGDNDPARPEPEVSLADAGIAAEIAHAAARGRGADRTPTLEQLLAAFGEPEPTAEARRRVAAALRVAGMGVRPELSDAEPGQRLLLLPPGAVAGPGRGRALLGLLAVAGVLIVAAGGAALLGGGDDRASDSLPSSQTTRFTPPATVVGGAGDDGTGTTATTGDGVTTATGTTVGADGSGTTATDDGSGGSGTTGDGAGDVATTTTSAADDAAARERRRARRRAAARRRQVAVVVDASAAPTFLCVDDGDGHQLYAGTLSGRETFRRRRVRLNVGLASTVVTVDGHPVRLSGSPAGLDITRRGGARDLPLGQRPCG